MGLGQWDVFSRGGGALGAQKSRDEASKVPERITGGHQLYPASSILFMEALATNAHSQNQELDHILLLQANYISVDFKNEKEHIPGKRRKKKFKEWVEM